MSRGLRFTGFHIDAVELGKSVDDLCREPSLAATSSASASQHRTSLRLQVFLRELDYQVDRAATAYRDAIRDVITQLNAVRQKWRFLSPETCFCVYDSTKKLAMDLRDAIIFMKSNSETVQALFASNGTTQRRNIESSESANPECVLLGDAERALIMRDPCPGLPRVSSKLRKHLVQRLRPDNIDSKLSDLRVYQGTHAIIGEIRKRLDALRYIESCWLRSGALDKEEVYRRHRRRDTEAIVSELYEVARTAQPTHKWFLRLAEEAKIDYEAQPVGEASTLGLMINNLNTFLYIANYCTAVPTASLYAEAVGLSASTSGFLLSAAPFASCFASVIYSWWSNYNFKMPLMFCNVLLLSGNWLYATAYDHKAAWMLFAGRLLIGLGGNRAVNRRYISDFVPQSRRSFHSAIFVAVGALGMSLGPALQPLLEIIPDIKIPYVGYSFNKMTATAFVMMVAWALFSIATLLFFDEPQRTNAVKRADLLAPLLDSDNLTRDLTIAGYKDFLLSNTDESLPRAAFRGREPVTSCRTPPGPIVCLWIYFCLKFAQEAFQTACPVYSEQRFGWSDGEVSILLSTIGLVVLPSTAIIAMLECFCSERTSQILSLALLTAGSVLCCSWAVPLLRIPAVNHQTLYIAGALLIFLSAQTLESINMSLLSKITPRSWSVGLLNAGFLSTEAGTLGRVLGSALITVAAAAVPLMDLQTAVTICTGAMCLSAVLSCIYFWKSLNSTARSELDSPEGCLGAEYLEDLDIFGSSTPALRPLCISRVSSVIESLSTIEARPSKSRTRGCVKANPDFPPLLECVDAQQEASPWQEVVDEAIDCHLSSEMLGRFRDFRHQKLDEVCKEAHFFQKQP